MNDQKWEHSENHWSLCLRFWDFSSRKCLWRCFWRCFIVQGSVEKSAVTMLGLRSLHRDVCELPGGVCDKYRIGTFSTKVTHVPPHNCELFHANLWWLQHQFQQLAPEALPWLEDYSPLPDCQCLHLSLSVLRLKKPKGCDTKLQTLQRWVGGNWVAAVPLRHSPLWEKLTVLGPTRLPLWLLTRYIYEILGHDPKLQCSKWMLRRLFKKMGVPHLYLSNLFGAITL